MTHKKITNVLFNALLLSAGLAVSAVTTFMPTLFNTVRSVYAATPTPSVQLIDPQSVTVANTPGSSSLSGAGELMSCGFQFQTEVENDTFLNSTLGVSYSSLKSGLGYSASGNQTYFNNLTSKDVSFIESNYNKQVPVIQLVDLGNLLKDTGADCSSITLMRLSSNQWEGVQFCAFQNNGQSTATTIGAGQSCLGATSSIPGGPTPVPETIQFHILSTSSSANQSTGTLTYYDNGKNGTNATQETASVTVSKTPSSAPKSSSTGTGPIGTGTPVTPVTVVNQTQHPTPDCISSGATLAWIICPVINGIAQAELSLENVIKSLLITPPLNLTSTDKSSLGYITYHVWSNFRVYGDLVLVVALLVVVFGEAIGGGLIDAYTAKKMLPRILVAAILINLSIYIVVVLEDIFNVLGSGIESLISAPFQAAGQWKLSLGGWSSATTTGVLGAGLIYTIAAGGEGLAFLGLFVVLPVLVAAVGILLTLLLRNGILLFLLFTSPIAFAMYCLPNTEQYFKKWWGLLLRTLAV